MSTILKQIPLPRKLDSANAAPAAHAQKTYTFSNDVVEYLRQRDEGLEAALQQIYEDMGALGAPALSYGSPVGLAPDGANADGVSADIARADHVHATPAAAPSQGIGADNTEGAASSFARADHDHKLRETGGPTDLTIGAIADGKYVKRSGSVLVGVDVNPYGGPHWLADARPSSPSSYDVEFDSALSGWTKYDPGAKLTETQENGFALFTCAHNATVRVMQALYKAKPSESEWFAWTKATLGESAHNASTEFNNAGVFIAQDLTGTSTTADWVIAEAQQTGFSGGSVDCLYQTLGSGSTGAAALTTGNIAQFMFNRNSLYIGLGFNGTSYSAWFSNDGVGWYPTSTGISLTSSVHFGLFCWNSTGNTARNRFHYFRVNLAAGCSNPNIVTPPGRLLS